MSSIVPKRIIGGEEILEENCGIEALTAWMAVLDKALKYFAFSRNCCLRLIRD